MKSTILTLLILSVGIVLHSQNENPFAKFGYEVLTATSSKGEFKEFHDQTDVVEIGSVLYNTRTNEIVKVLFFLFTMIFLSCSSTNHSTSFNQKDSKYLMYKIKEIYNHELFDIIYAQKSDSTFKIISLRDTIIPSTKPLEVGKKYQLDLVQIYPDFDNEKTKVGAKDSCLMGIEKHTHFSLYSATNLNGMFLSENDKDATEVLNKFCVYEILGDAVQRNKNSTLTVLYLK